LGKRRKRVDEPIRRKRAPQLFPRHVRGGHEAQIDDVELNARIRGGLGCLGEGERVLGTLTGDMGYKSSLFILLTC